MTNDDSNKSNKKDNFQNQMSFSVFSSLKFSISAFPLGSYYFAQSHDSVRLHKRTIDLFSSNFWWRFCVVTAFLAFLLVKGLLS